MPFVDQKTGKRFVGCTGYFIGHCRTSFLLPQKGWVKPLGDLCKGCGVPTAKVWMSGKKPCTLCFNLRCELRKS